MKQYQIKNTQSGFTLIELVVVIVILGILAATALPKFANLQVDARVSAVNAAKGAVGAAANLAHATFLARGTTATTGTETIEGQTATNVNGYPKKEEIFLLAGLSSEYDLTTPGQAQLNGAKDKTKCKVTYADSTAANTPPTITTDVTDC